MIKLVPIYAMVLLVLFMTGCSTYDDPKFHTSHSNLSELGLALAQYAQDHKNRLPPLSNIQKLKKALAPYVGPPIDTILIDPISGRPYGLNSELSETNPDLITRDNSKAVIFETDTAADGTRGVLLLAGYHVRRFDDKQWQRVKPAFY